MRVPVVFSFRLVEAALYDARFRVRDAVGTGEESLGVRRLIPDRAAGCGLISATRDVLSAGSLT